MKEIKDIIAAFEKALLNNKKSALATVVNVQGSSYRRPGARMLITEDGELTGAISGGCLEGDALKKAVLAITQNKKKLVIYDTTDEDDAKLGIQLGCNGIVSILFEPALDKDLDNPIRILKNVVKENDATILISGYSLNQQRHFGTCDLNELPIFFREPIFRLSETVRSSGISMHDVIFFENNQQEFFIEYWEPPISILIVGAGNDAMPLVSMSQILGWDITLVDGRPAHASKQRFPSVANILVGKPQEIIGHIELNDHSAVVIMTHNYNYDLEMLMALKDSTVAYIGILGPMSKRNRILNELEERNVLIPEKTLQKIYGPTGLDIGAETSEEIALSVTSEIFSVIRKKRAIHLREKQHPIHQQRL